MFLSVFGRSRSISLFKYRAKITLVGKPCLLRNLQDAEILIRQQFHGSSRTYLQENTVHYHLRSDIVHNRIIYKNQHEYPFMDKY